MTMFTVPAFGSGGGGGGGGGNAPTGTVVSFAGAAAPADWLLCDGAIYLIATYPTLGALLGATYGGDGITTFGVPDARGRVLIGVGAGVGLTPRLLAATGGEEAHTQAGGEVGSHGHGTTDPGHTHPFTIGSGNVAAAGVGLVNGQVLLPGTFTDPTVIVPAATGLTVNATAAPTPANVMNPFLALNAIIRT